MTWYDNLEKSPYTPPPIVFRVVWPILYVLLAMSFSRVESRGASNANRLGFLMQLVFNFAWPLLFFTFQSMCVSIGVVILMIATAIPTSIHLYFVDRLAALLWLPYIMWLIFAWYLNVYICFKN